MTITTRSDALNDALERLEGYRYLDGEGFPTHGPMAAEAISALGYDDEVGDWVEWYKAHHVPLDPPPAKEAMDVLDEADWRAALGDFVRISDWDAAFQRQLAGTPWQDVVRLWVPRLLPGYGGALGHGLIRTSHAVRGLQGDATPSDLRLGELARGLALWAAAYTEPPGEVGLQGERSLAEALIRLPRLHPDVPITPMEAATFARLDDVPGFSNAVEALGPPASPADGLGEMTMAFCRVMLAHPEAPVALFVHTVTPIVVARSLLAIAEDVPTTALYAHAWRVNAALTAGFTHSAPATETAATATDEIPVTSDLLDLAIEHRDPHVLKFTEAVLREHSDRPDDTYLLAAQHVIHNTARG